jgi:DNA-binding MarR family transcriptional regulator
MKSEIEESVQGSSTTAYILLETLPSVMGYVTSELRRNAPVDNPVHFRLLRTLRRGRRTLHELAELHSVRLPTMSRTVSVMEGRGWLDRERSTEDRRTVFVSLTPSGEESLEVVEKMAIDRASTLLNRLSESEVTALHSGLKALHRVVQEHLGMRFEEGVEPAKEPGCGEL